MSWTLTTLGEISDFIRNGSSIKQDDGASGLPITRIETIAKRKVNFEKCGYADIQEYEYLDRRLIYGDILISHINSEKHLGKCAIFESGRKDVIHGMNLLCLRPNGSVDAKYVFYYLSSTQFLNLLPKITKKSVNQASFNVKDYKDLSIPLPPLPVQKQIAAVLEKADTLRGQCQQMEQELNTLAQSVFLDMFGDPVKNPMEWPESSLLEVCTKVTDGTHQTPEWSDKGIPFLFISNVRKGKVNFNTNKFITERCYIDLTRTSPIEVNDILYTTVGSYGHVALVDDSFPKFCFQRHIAHIKPDNSKINPSFLYYQLQTSGIKHLADIAVKGIAQKTLNLKDLKAFKILLPPIELQNELVKRMVKIRSGIDTTDEQRIENKELFQSLMQRAFKGELTLKKIKDVA